MIGDVRHSFLKGALGLPPKKALSNSVTIGENKPQFAGILALIPIEFREQEWALSHF
jgi:hypothetical protein